MGPLIFIVAILVVVGWYGNTQGWFTGTGNITGRVVDNYNTAFADAVIEATCAEHGRTAVVAVNRDGQFIYRDLHTGTYEITLVTWVGKYPMVPKVVNLRRNATEFQELHVDQTLIGAQRSKLYANVRAQAASAGGGGGGGRSFGGG